ncbi:mycothiol transferase [Aeromicrobium stalagmiti]|uniref:mycothiol transferase n=1 Tax=Aeromicrobium stalagmiti TaxID=2738988 RepID=UPI001569FE40|nr:DUF664 domain-containing protein [Aeromicrobium stalagmiti]NRQ49068.1 DUF664 domain-containing protein [Aeromicrobium stalagmiti]
MTAARGLLTDAFGRIRADIDAILDDLDEAALSRRLTPGSNTIGWLLWHLLRVQDDHFADVAGTEQVWTALGWYDRFDLPFDAMATGYGHSTDEVAAVHVSPSLLAGYSHDVHDASQRLIDSLDDAALARVVDDRWDPPVTLGARLVSVIGDDLKHLGQAEYVKGAIR